VLTCAINAIFELSKIAIRKEKNAGEEKIKRKGAKAQGKRNLILRFSICDLAPLRLTFLRTD